MEGFVECNNLHFLSSPLISANCTRYAPSRLSPYVRLYIFVQLLQKLSASTGHLPAQYQIHVRSS
jgi:hypothetical protein